MSEQLFQPFFDDVKREEASQAVLLGQLTTSNPDLFVEAQDLSEELKTPAPAILQEPDIYRQAAQSKRNIAALLPANRIRSWLQNPQNAAVAQDDLTVLGAIEGAVGAIPEAAQRGGLRALNTADITNLGIASDALRDVDKSVPEILNEIVSPEEQERLAVQDPDLLTRAEQEALRRYEFAQRVNQDDAIDLFVTSFERALARQGRIDELDRSEAAANTLAALEGVDTSSVGEVFDFVTDNFAGVTALLLETAVESAPSLAVGAAAGLATRSPLVAAGALGVSSGTLEGTSEALDFVRQSGRSLETREDYLSLLTDQDLLQEANERGFLRGLVIGTVDFLSGGIAGKVLSSSPVGDAIAQTLVQMTLGSTGELAAQRAVGDEPDFFEAFLEGAAEGITAPIEVSLIGGRNIIKEVQAARRSGQTAEALTAIDETVAESKLRQRAPEKFKSAVEAIAEGQREIIVPAEDVQEFFQSQNLPDEAIQKWGVSIETYQEKLASGGDVLVSVDDYAGISGTPDADFIKQYGSFNLDEKSAIEAIEFNDRAREILEEARQEAEEVAVREIEARASDVQVSDDVFSQLRAAGRTVDVARRESEVVGAFFRTLANRYGDDALDLYRQYRPRIQGAFGAPLQRVRSQVDIALNTLRKSPAKAPKNQSLGQFIRALGGLNDIGGNIRALDPPKGTVSETGLNLDEAGRKALEAGFFQELAGELTGANEGLAADLANVLLEALEGELRGNPVYRTAAVTEDPLQALQDSLDELGLNLSELTNDQVIEALEAASDALFQDERGSIQFPRGGLKDGETVISLFENADLSTFLHESGHYFLAVFEDIASLEGAPVDMKADMETIHKYLGSEPGQGFTVEQQEKWARSFEAYAMEGKAPSLGLAEAFSRFKAWLTRIYKTVLNLDVSVTPEIRDVMDRMLATESEIKAAREDLAMQPLFRDEAPPGMSEGDYKTYQRLARHSQRQADERLLNRTMEKIRRERKEWFRREREGVKKQVAETVNSQREYRLIEMLANQRWFGSEEVQIPDMQIDRDQLVDMFGDGVVTELSRSRLGGKRSIIKKGGESPDVIAEFFGFRDVAEMVQVLQNTEKKNITIERETDRIMTERYGDPLNDGSIEEDALLAVHAEKRGDLVVSETRHIARQTGRKVDNLKSRTFKARAKRIIAELPVRDVLRPDVFLRAERKSAREAEKAFAASLRKGGDAEFNLEAAFKAKERQALNHFLYIEARDAQAKINKGREKMRRYENRKVREAIGQQSIEQIDALLEGYEFRKRSNRQIERTESLHEFVQRMKDEGREGELAIPQKVLADSAKKHYTRISVSDLFGLFDAVDNLDHIGRRRTKVIDHKSKRELRDAVNDVVNAIQTNLKAKPRSRVETRGDKARKIGREYLNLTLNADTHLKELDGFQNFGPSYRWIKQSIDEATSRLTARRKTLAEDLDRIYDAYSDREKRQMSERRHYPELGETLDRWSILAIALNTGNEGNYQRLTNHRVKGSYTPGQVEAVLKTLDERDWRVVQDIWDYLQSYWPEISAKEERMTGLKPKQVEHKLMAAAPDFVKGGYYPIKYDPRYPGRAGDQDAQSLTESLIGGRFGKAQTRNGHTMERVQNVNASLSLSLSVLHNHLSQVVYDIELGEAVSNSWRILNHDRVKDAFLSVGKKSDHEALQIWLQDVAAGDRSFASGGEAILRHFRSGFVISRLALNTSTALIQPTGLFQSAVVVGKRDIARGVLTYLRNPARWRAEVREVSPFMRERQDTFERDVFNVVGDLEDGPVTGRWAKFHRDYVVPLSFMLMQKVQFYAVDLPTWVGAYQKELNRSSDESKARFYADRMVAEAQGSGLMSDRGMLERGTTNRESRQRELPKLFTALGSYMFAKGNIAYRRTREVDWTNPYQVFNWAADMVLLFTFEALLYNVVKGFGPEEDEDLEAWLVKETGYSVMSSFPGLREVSGGIQGFGEGGIFGSIVRGAVVDPLTQGSQGELDRAAVKSMINMGGIFFHLPSSQANAIITGLLDEDLNLRDDASVLAPVGLGVGENSIAERLFGTR